MDWLMMTLDPNVLIIRGKPLSTHWLFTKTCQNRKAAATPIVSVYTDPQTPDSLGGKAW